jgi:hypothetical protein
MRLLDMRRLHRLPAGAYRMAEAEGVAAQGQTTAWFDDR